ncbi:membrane or secreted protein [Pontibacter sp. 13R65]|uniref:membrane or secreted protein n=1 Tax=Pontibacter sp. 13R65 TaxID=3127458 RepID=UPI00301D3234
MMMQKLFPGKKMLCLGVVLLMGFTMPETELMERKAPTHAQQPKQATALEGAWRLSKGADANVKTAAGETVIKLVADGFFSVAVFDKEQKKFLGTYGGSYSTSNGKLTETYDFHTLDSTLVGTSVTSTYSLKQNNLQQKTTTGTAATWEKMAASGQQGQLTGAWRISARETKVGEMSTITPGPRRTIKVLAGNRFQWIAFNSETAGFFGTGGGTYTTTNGKYTENIEFFSRDSSRVGQQLSFDFELKNGDWHHSGLSSTGNKINETWQRLVKP